MTRSFGFDLETTGLDPKSDWIVEVGMHLTTGAPWFNPVDDLSIVISAPEQVLLGMVEIVRNMHKGTGLWDEVLASEYHTPDAEKAILRWMDQHDLVKDVTVGGSGISRFDVPFMVEQMPFVAERFHYRHLDVSPVRALLSTVEIGIEVPFEGTAHRGLDDAIHAADYARAFLARITKETS